MRDMRSAASRIATTFPIAAVALSMAAAADDPARRAGRIDPVVLLR